jgi:Tol biopolymer transport system component/DNA-binding winged helix-turn-helix (wHTH) protein
MLNSAPSASVYEFGPFRLDIPEGRLLRDGEPVVLPPKVFDLLAALVHREGRLATKDELMHEVWPDTFVDEGNLTQSVFTLRRALGDGTDGAKYVETVPRRGYRMAVPVLRPELEAVPVVATPPLGVRELAPAVVPPPAVASAPNLGRLSRLAASRPLQWGVAAVAVVATGWFAVGGIGRDPGRLRFETPTFNRVTTTGDVVDATMSPDGRFIALVRGEAGRWGLWLHQIATGNTLQIGPDQDVLIDKLTFSADGERLYFVKTQRDGAAALFATATLGGPERHILEGLSSPVAVSPDGASLAFVRWYPAEGERVLMVSRADGSQPRALLKRRSPAVIMYQGPSWSPDGTRVAVVANEAFGGQAAALLEVDVATGVERAIATSLPWNSGKAVWTADGRGLLLAAGQLWHVSYPDGRVRQLTREVSSYGRLSLTRDGGALMAVQHVETSAMWLAEGGDPARDTHVLTESGFNHGVAWLPDGRLMFESATEGDVDVWVTDRNGRSKGRIVSGAGIDYFPATAASGTFFVFASGRAGGSTIWRSALDGGGAMQISTEGVQYAPDVSPDGRWVVYHRADPTRSWLLWRVAATGGASKAMTDQPSTFPVYSPDGGWIVCNYRPAQSTAAGWVIAILAADTGEPRRLIDVPGPPTRRFTWSPDGRWIYYSAPDDSIWRVGVDGHGTHPERVRQFAGERVVTLRWSPDGKELAYVRHTEANDVVLIRDTPSGLR